jgi:hypothetical protein
LKIEQIGHMFGLSYSRVGHAVNSARIALSKNRQLQMQIDRLNSQFKLSTIQIRERMRQAVQARRYVSTIWKNQVWKSNINSPKKKTVQNSQN